MMLKESAASCPKRNLRRLTDPALPAEIQLWLIDLDAPVDGPGILSADEWERARAFRFPIHRQRFAVCRTALRELLGEALGCSANGIQFYYSPEGKPGCAGVHFNVAHSENLALIAVAPHPVGVDIEFKRQVEFDALAATVFSPAELAVWKRFGESEKAEKFYALWTRKEALLKGIGCGITEHTGRVSVFFGDSDVVEVPSALTTEVWSVRSFEIAEGYAAAVAWTAK